MGAETGFCRYGNGRRVAHKKEVVTIGSTVKDLQTSPGGGEIAFDARGNRLNQMSVVVRQEKTESPVGAALANRIVSTRFNPKNLDRHCSQVWVQKPVAFAGDWQASERNHHTAGSIEVSCLSKG